MYRRVSNSFGNKETNNDLSLALGPYHELSESFVSIPLSSQQAERGRSTFVLEDEDLFASTLRHNEQVDTLLELLGSSEADSGVSREDIRALLDIYDGDVDRVASCLLERDFSALQLAKDFELAKALAAEQGGTLFPPSEDNNTVDTTPLASSREQRFIHSVKEILIPQLSHELVGMCFPDIENNGQKYEYQLRNLSLEWLHIPIDQVQVTVMHPSIHVDCDNVELKIAIGHWEYRRKGNTLRFQDDGQAQSMLSGIRVGLIIRSHMEQNRELPHLGVDKCMVSVGNIRFRFGGTKASWLYNLVSTLFQSQLKKNVEAVLNTTISSAVDSQLEQWSQWMFAENGLQDE